MFWLRMFHLMSLQAQNTQQMWVISKRLFAFMKVSVSELLAIFLISSKTHEHTREKCDSTPPHALSELLQSPANLQFTKQKLFIMCHTKLLCWVLTVGTFWCYKMLNMDLCEVQHADCLRWSSAVEVKVSRSGRILCFCQLTSYSLFHNRLFHVDHSLASAWPTSLWKRLSPA